MSADSGANYQAHIAAMQSMKDQSSHGTSVENLSSGSDMGSAKSSLENLGPAIMTPKGLRIFGEGQGVGDFLSNGGITLFVTGTGVMDLNLDNISSLMQVQVAHEGVMKDLQSLGNVGLGEATGLVTNLNAKIPNVSTHGQGEQH